MSRFKFGDWVEDRDYGCGRFVRTMPSGLSAEVLFGELLCCVPIGTLTPYTPPAPAGTVPVRIAVAVGEDGYWSADGCSEWDESKTVAIVKFDPQPCRISWITAHVPLPQPPAEVEGVVEGGGE